METSLVERFAAAVAGRDSDVDLFGAAMVIAALSGDDPDPHDVARQLDFIAEAVREAAGDSIDPGVLAHAVDHELFTVRGFHGATGNYSAPENSYLHCVLDRRTGLPIGVSLVYMEVAQRIGLRCDPVGYPGHFIVRCGDPGAPIYVDPFNQGVRLDRDELLLRLQGQHLGGATPDSFLAAITRRQVLQRMLRNLHAAFRECRDLDRWRTTVELCLVLEPWNAALVGERGMLHYRLGDPSAALADLQRYVGAAKPEGVSAGALRLLQELRLRLGGSEEPA